MAASIFKAAWWPVHVAVAWALTRDRVFVERCNRPGRSLRSITVALAMDKVQRKATERHFKRDTAAWSALREEIAAGNVRASGTPFRLVADLQGLAAETNELAREIPAAEIASLRLQDDGHDKDCLIPEDWRVAHGSNRNNLRGYRNVQVFRDDVLRVFVVEASTPNGPDWKRLPEAANSVMASGLTDDQVKQASVAPKSKSGLGAKAKGISEAISQLWPNEIPKGLSAKDRNNAIIDRMRQNGSSIPNSPERAIQRVLQTRQSK
jgi:hypothetical protein